MPGLGLGNVSDTQEKAIVALLNEPTIQRAAVSAGVGERTLHRWLQEDVGFVNAYAKARKQAYCHAVALAHRYAPLAVQTLARICNNEKISAATRVQAAAHLLRVGRDAIELDDILARLDAIEAASGALEGKKVVLDAEAHVSVATPPDRKTAPTPSPFTTVGGTSQHPVLLPPPPVKRGRPKKPRTGGSSGK